MARTLAAIAIVSVAACIDDPTLVNDDPIPLSRADAELLGLQVWRQIFENALAAADDPEASSGPAAAPVQFAAAQDTTLTCELGGTIDAHIEVSGSGDDETGEIELTLAVTQAHHGCVEDTGDGTRFSLDGWPDVTATLTFGLDSASTITLTGSIVGAIRASAGGRSGICAVDIAFGGQQDAGGVGSYTVGGTMCGASVDESVDVG